MEPESPSPYPQVPATCPYPEPTPSSAHDPHKLLNHPKTQTEREIFTERKWLKIKEEMAFWENCGAQQNCRSEKFEG